MRISGIMAIAAILCASTGAFAASTYTVKVGGYTAGTGGGYYGGSSDTPMLMFDPADITINVGDSIKFVNQSSGSLTEFHNVDADDHSFRCANGCDGQGGNGDPASNLWNATVTFTKAGTITYHCDTHGSMGMTGSITVNSVAAAGQNIVGGLSGNWFNPTANQGGHGFQIEVLPGNGLLAIWFVFNPAGTAQTWIYAQGTYDSTSNTATIPGFIEQGGAFPPNFDATKISAPQDGSLTLSFTDCNNGTASWTPNDAGTTAGYMATSFPIQRLTNIAGTTCP